jgi:hypothetical protein
MELDDIELFYRCEYKYENDYIFIKNGYLHIYCRSPIFYDVNLLLYPFVYKNHQVKLYYQKQYEDNNWEWCKVI